MPINSFSMDPHDSLLTLWTQFPADPTLSYLGMDLTFDSDGFGL